MGYFKIKGIDINAKTTAGETPMMIAAREGKAGIVNLILNEFRPLIKK